MSCLHIALNCFLLRSPVISLVLSKVLVLTCSPPLPPPLLLPLPLPGSLVEFQQAVINFTFISVLTLLYLLFSHEYLFQECLTVDSYVINPLGFWLSKNIYITFTFLNDDLVGYKILGSKFFFLQIC